MAEEQCDERYGAPGPRDEPFEVTYRCGKFRGHAGGHGPADPPLGSKADKPIREQSALELLETHAKALEAENARLRPALERYGSHTSSCRTRDWTAGGKAWDDATCDCGLRDALRGAVETESKPPREIWACVSKGISPPYVRFFESKAEMEAYEWRDDSVSPNRYRPAVETAASPGPMPDWARLLLECRDALPGISLAWARLHGLDLTLDVRIERMLEPWRVPDGEEARYPAPSPEKATGDV